MSKREYIYAIDEEFVESPFGVSTSLGMTITRTEIIRCRDCKWFKANATPYDPDGRYNFCTQFGFDFKGSDGFCAWAVRK